MCGLLLGLHTVNTKRYDTGTGEMVPVVSVSLTVKRYLWSPWPDRLCYEFLSLTCVVLLFLNSLTRMISRIGEQNQWLRQTLTKLTEANEHYHALSYFPPNAIKSSGGLSRCLGIFGGYRTRCVLAHASNNLFYLLKQNGARKRNGAFQYRFSMKW